MALLPALAASRTLLRAGGTTPRHLFEDQRPLQGVRSRLWQCQKSPARCVAATKSGGDSMAQDGAEQPGPDTSLVADELVQYVVVRRDLYRELGWPLGSLLAQACHAAVAAVWLSRDAPHTRAYCGEDGRIDHMHKVVLEVAGEAGLRGLAEKLEAAGVPHKLWVEQPEAFPTCLATCPAYKAAVQPHFKKLKLCKGT